MTDYKKLHHGAIVADLHCDSIHQIKRGFDFYIKNENYHIDLPRLKEGGVNLEIFALFLDSSTPETEHFSSIDNLLTVLKNCFSNSSEISLCYSYSDITKALQENKIAALVAIENGMAIESSIENLEYFANQGIKYMTLTHANSHNWCTSSSDKHADEFGLTNFGIDVIKKMNDLKMIIDVSHISVKAFNDVIANSSQPLLASHSNAHTLCSHDRNLTDKQLKALADNGGIVGINFCPSFLSDKLNVVSEKFLKEHEEEYKNAILPFTSEPDEEKYQNTLKQFQPFYDRWKKIVEPFAVTVENVCDHIDYIKNLIGADHVALGSDFDGILYTPTDLNDISQMPLITKELLRRNYSENDIQKILGKNFLRLFKEITS